MVKRFAVVIVMVVLLVKSPIFGQNLGLLVFEGRAPAERNRDIYIMHVDGSEVRNLTVTEDINEFSPSWSPDGLQIAYGANSGKRFEIYIIGSTGDYRKRIRRDIQDLSALAWSPTDYRIAFVADKVLFLVDADGTNARPLVLLDQPVDKILWSLDGKFVLLGNDRDLTLKVEINTGEMQSLIACTTCAIDNELPEQQYVALVEENRQDSDIYIVHTKTGEQTRLTDTPDISEMNPVWHPLMHTNCEVFASRPANLRTGPSQKQGHAETLITGQSVTAVGRYEGNSRWLLLDNDLWIRADLTSYNCDSLPEVAKDGSVAIQPEIELDYTVNCTVYALRTTGVNKRRFPGRGNQHVGVLYAGEAAVAVGQYNGVNRWWLLDDGSWVREDTVTEEEKCSELPEIKI